MFSSRMLLCAISTLSRCDLRKTQQVALHRSLPRCAFLAEVGVDDQKAEVTSQRLQ